MSGCTQAYVSVPASLNVPNPWSPHLQSVRIFLLDKERPDKHFTSPRMALGMLLSVIASGMRFAMRRLGRQSNRRHAASRKAVARKLPIGAVYGLAQWPVHQFRNLVALASRCADTITEPAAGSTEGGPVFTTMHDAASASTMEPKQRPIRKQQSLQHERWLENKNAIQEGTVEGIDESGTWENDCQKPGSPGHRDPAAESFWQSLQVQAASAADAAGCTTAQGRLWVKGCNDAEAFYDTMQTRAADHAGRAAEDLRAWMFARATPKFQRTL